ncbi:MAG TPA: carbonic anhydrase family protein [Chloroflexota bacterium]|nr:carbonic anhydrase family protein [Chloroflexota bacterium]
MTTMEATEASAPPPDGEVPLPAVAEAGGEPAVIKVTGSRFGGPLFKSPLVYAIVGVPLLLLSFLGTMLVSRGGAPAPAATHHEWSYEGAAGPTHWGEGDPHAATCQTGAEQSPVDIHPSRLLQLEWLVPVQPKYKASKVRLQNVAHTARIAFDPGSRMVFQGREYELTETPSEHKINGRAADMELQLLHATPDSSRAPAVISLMATEGAENPTLAKIWQQLPDKEGPEVKTTVDLNPQDLLPRNLRFYYYDGSLTTPPCTEGGALDCAQRADLSLPCPDPTCQGSFQDERPPGAGHQRPVH